ncbi:MAG: MMPL family transporter, partial [Gammaproteobacteria bacterium]|nr:MMPL family transporter [Gammaproteobacteria bacterium]
MQGLLLLFSRRPWLWLALLCLASLLAATQLSRLEVRVSADEMLVINDPQRSYYNETRAMFGDERVVVLVVESDKPLTEARLDVLRQVIDAVEALPFVAQTESLFNVPYVKSIDGYLDKKPYLDKIPVDDAAAQDLLQAAASNPLIRNILVAADGSALAVAVVLRNDETHVDDKTLSDTLDAAIAPLREVYQRAYVIGSPQVRSEISSRIIEEQSKLLPFAVVALLIALFLLLRHFLDIVTPLLTAAISILWTFGLMGWLGIPVNVVTSTIPVLLIIVGSTEDIHLLAEFRHAQRTGATTDGALTHMARKMGRTVLLTFITTYIGFLSVGLSNIEVLRQFGFVASTGLFFNFVVTIMFIPAALSVTGRLQCDRGPRPFADDNVIWAARYWRFLTQQRWQVIIILVLGAALVAVGIPRIKVNHNPVENLGSASPVAERLNDLNQRFAGLESFSVIVESGIQDTFLHTRYLEELVKLQRHIRSLDDSLSVTSFGDYLVLLNNAFLESDDAGLPSSNDEIAELMIFLDHDRVKNFVTADYSQARILIRHAITDAATLRRLLKEIRSYVDQHLDPGLRARITGDSVLSLSSTHSMIMGQLQSVLLILTLFVIIVSFIFTDVRVGLLAALPNIFPMVILFGVMGFADIPLNIGTTMAAAIAIGVAVDDTLHFMLRYNQELRTSKSHTLAMQNTIREEALPIVSTSLA